MKKRYLLLIPVAVCVLISAAAYGFVQLRPDRAPEQLQPLVLRSNTQKPQENTGSGSGTDAEEVTTTSAEQEQAAQLTADMTLEQKLYQMLFVRPEALTGAQQVTRAGDATKTALAEMPVGGILYTKNNLTGSGQAETMIKNTQEFAQASGAKIPLFIGIEEEGGLVTNADALSTTSYDTMYSLGGNTAKAAEIGQTYAKQLGALGFNVNFAPNADVLDSSDNTVTGGQSFGTDASVVSEMVANEVKGMQQNNMMAVLKHFPGYGSVNSGNATDRTKEELLASDIKPFEAGIQQNAAFILVSTMTDTNLDDVPCCLSSAVMTDLLRKQLGYTGIIMTDELDAGGLGEQADGNAVVQAVQAGADVLLCPASVSEAYDALHAAVEEGDISESRIDESVQRILTAKLTYGVIA